MKRRSLLTALALSLTAALLLAACSAAPLSSSSSSQSGKISSANSSSSSEESIPEEESTVTEESVFSQDEISSDTSTSDSDSVSEEVPLSENSSAAEEDSGPPSFANFTAQDIYGNERDESLFADYDLTMINIWATFCGPCLDEMPDLGELSDEYADKGVQIVGIVIDTLDYDGKISQGTVDLAVEIVEKLKADYVHLLPSEDLIAAKLYAVSAVPETVFVDRDGNIVGSSYIGSRDKIDWTNIIDNLLKDVRG